MVGDVAVASRRYGQVTNILRTVRYSQIQTHGQGPFFIFRTRKQESTTFIKQKKNSTAMSSSVPYDPYIPNQTTGEQSNSRTAAIQAVRT